MRGIGINVPTAVGSTCKACDNRVVSGTPITANNSSNSVLSSINSVTNVDNLSDLADDNTNIRIRMDISGPSRGVVTNFSTSMAVTMNSRRGVIAIPVRSVILRGANACMCLCGRRSGAISGALVRANTISSSTCRIGDKVGTNSGVISAPSSSCGRSAFRMGIGWSRYVVGVSRDLGVTVGYVGTG